MCLFLACAVCVCFRHVLYVYVKRALCVNGAVAVCYVLVGYLCVCVCVLSMYFVCLECAVCLLSLCFVGVLSVYVCFKHVLLRVCVFEVCACVCVLSVCCVYVLSQELVKVTITSYVVRLCVDPTVPGALECLFCNRN